jgi:hypothetical protein
LPGSERERWCSTSTKGNVQNGGEREISSISLAGSRGGDQEGEREMVVVELGFSGRVARVWSILVHRAGGLERKEKEREGREKWWR